MRNIVSGALGSSLLYIPITQTTVEIVCQCVIALATVYYQFINHKKGGQNVDDE